MEMILLRNTGETSTIPFLTQESNLMSIFKFLSDTVLYIRNLFEKTEFHALRQKVSEAVV